VIRASILMLLLFTAPAFAQGGIGDSPDRFDHERARRVYDAALNFMVPRILEPTSVPELAAWGLGGIAALDPRLRAELNGETLRLRQILGVRGGERVLFTRAMPAKKPIADWARTIADLQEVAFGASRILRDAGSSAVVQGFFDELFNHLDAYSRYTPPAEAAEDRTRRAGRAGIGVSLLRKGRHIVVHDTAVAGPAATEGIRPGDILLSVDDQATLGQDLRTVLRWLQGHEGTDVTISWRDREGKVNRAVLTREMIPPETVHAVRTKGSLVLRISDFNNATGTRVATEIITAFSGSTPPRGLIFDLRGNRGGVLYQAVITADAVLSPGIIAMTVGRDPNATRVLPSVSRDLVPFLPVVVVVDGRTASAAEVLAAALGDRGRAVVVGSSTLGKGLVQTIAPMPDGGELRLTWSRIIAPGGWPIHGLGVMPQICTSLGQLALNRQLDELAAGRAPMATALARHHTARAPLPVDEALELRTPCPAAEGRDVDMRIAHLLVDSPSRYAAALLPPMGSPPDGSPPDGSIAAGKP